jgi:predicted RNA-binding Zn-ribbon protein involved in translation (DUF1610 family)
VSDGLPKKQPAELTCPRCGDAIIWRECSQCGGLGAWQFIASSHCGVPQQGKFCSECGATLPAWVESCAFCAGRGWLAAEHVCSAADQPPPGKPFRVDPATWPAPVVVAAAAAPPLPVVTSAPPASPISVPAVAVAAAPAAATNATAAVSPVEAVSAAPQPVPGPATPEPKGNNRMNLWIAILFLAIFALLIASPELTDTIRRSFQAVFVR